MLVLTKMDAVTPEELARVKALFKDHPNVYAVSVLIDESIKTLQDFLTTFFRGKV
jgi:50S ribosomal subunit-associated GTPase HflX